MVVGYDMHTVVKPEGEAVAVTRVSEQYHKALAVRDAIPLIEAGQLTRAEADANFFGIPANATPRYRAAQTEVLRLSNVMDRTERSYFRLNIWGMGMVRRAMFDLGMAYEPVTEQEWPDHPDAVGHIIEALCDGDKSVTDYLTEWYPEKTAPTEAELDRAKTYVAECNEVRRNHPEGGTTIPLHKFDSNDGWVVTPAECLEALSAWHARTPGERDDALVEAKIDGPDWADLWKRWLEFLELAAHCDGFEVR